MKSNRQTIWLVSMLSLMVILSAYYLFTEESGTKAPKVAEGQQVSVQDKSNAKDTALVQTQDGTIVTEVSDLTGTGEKEVTTKESAPEKNDPASADDKSKEDATTGKTTQSKDNTQADKATETDKSTGTAIPEQKDAEVIKKIEAQGTAGNDAITNYQYQRATENSKMSDKLLQVIADQGKSVEDSAKAQKELAALQDKESKISDIEVKLQQQFANAVVTEKDSQYTVVVLSDKLEAKQAVSIVDLVIKELGVTQDKVRVQYISQ